MEYIAKQVDYLGKIAKNTVSQYKTKDALFGEGGAFNATLLKQS